MKLTTKLIGGFVFVSLVPLLLISLLLFLYVDSTNKNAYTQRADIAVLAFRSYLEDQLAQIEKSATDLSQNKDFLIDVLELPRREDDLTDLLQRRISGGDFQFALVRLKESQGVFKAYEDNLAVVINGYRFRGSDVEMQTTMNGLVKLSAANDNSVAAIATVPIFYRNAPVGELLVGKMLTAIAGNYRLNRSGLAALVVTSGNQVLYVGADSTRLPALRDMTVPQTDQAAWRTTIAGADYFGRQTQILGLDSKSVASIIYLFDQSELVSAQAHLLRVFILLALSALVLSVLLGYFYSRSISRPVAEMSEAARQIALGAVPEKILYFSDDEIGDLAAGINRLTEDLKTTEVKLRRSEQVAAWQMFARQTAHEIKNFLMPVTTTVGLLQRLSDNGTLDRARINDAVQSIQVEVMRMKQLLGAFVEFAKLPAPTLRRMSANFIIDDLRETFAEQLRDGHLHLSVDGRLPNAEFDRDQIRQVFLNLIVNSYEANASLVEVRAALDESRIRFEVTDDGDGLKVASGVDPFTPLYTTKERGSGLGLAICRRILVDHGGDISYQAGPTGGTVFAFYLPVEGA